MLMNYYQIFIPLFLFAYNVGTAPIFKENPSACENPILANLDKYFNIPELKPYIEDKPVPVEQLKQQTDEPGCRALSAKISKEVDQDGNGELNFEELKQYFRRFVMMADGDGDGCVSREEWEQFGQKCQKQSQKMEMNTPKRE